MKHNYTYYSIKYEFKKIPWLLVSDYAKKSVFMFQVASLFIITVISRIGEKNTHLWFYDSTIDLGQIHHFLTFSGVVNGLGRGYTAGNYEKWRGWPLFVLSALYESFRRVLQIMLE